MNIKRLLRKIVFQFQKAFRIYRKVDLGNGSVIKNDRINIKLIDVKEVYIR